MKIATKLLALLITGLFFASCQQEEVLPSESHYNHYPNELEKEASVPVENKSSRKVLKAELHVK